MNREDKICYFISKSVFRLDMLKNSRILLLSLKSAHTIEPTPRADLLSKVPFLGNHFSEHVKAALLCKMIDIREC